MPARPRNSKGARIEAATPERNGTAARDPGALDSIITMNAGGIIQSASDSVEHVFGWTPTELFGRNLSVLIPQPRRSALDRYLDRYRRAGSTVVSRTGRFEAIHKNGRVFNIELSVSRADLPAHSAPFFVGIIRDVSRQIDVETAPDDERSRLHNLITEQTRALATANLRLHLADRLASLGTLAAGLGHDMNNVLLPVRARLNALEQAEIPAAARAHVVAVRRSLAYLQRLSDGLHYLALDPDGPDAADGKGEAATYLGHWWNQVGALLRKAVPRHVRLTASLPAGLPAVAIAPHWLTQAALNLITNAGEAIPEGRKRPHGAVRVRAQAAPDGRHVRLSVADNGRGMSPGVQRRAFDLFFTTKARTMGTGLGLPLVRKVAARAGGRIELLSEPRKGTTVTLVLPIASRAAAGADSPSRGERTAAISVRDSRTGALVSQVVHEAGLTVAALDGVGPGASSVWVTDPTARALGLARPWRNRGAKGTVILLGSPPRAVRRAWADLGAIVIEHADDFEAMRDAVAEAAGAAPAAG